MEAHPVVLFDGVCNFCNATINFIIRHDRKKVFRYAALQSEAGQHLLKEYGLSASELNSFVLIMKGRAYTRTTAALHLYPLLGGAWKLTRALWIFPRPLRDLAYRLVARYRYRWFGKKDSCMVPAPEVRRLFLT